MKTNGSLMINKSQTFPFVVIEIPHICGHFHLLTLKYVKHAVLKFSLSLKFFTFNCSHLEFVLKILKQKGNKSSYKYQTPSHREQSITRRSEKV